MEKIFIVGSGASGVHFALSVLKKGYEVTMLDVGYPKPASQHPKDSIIELKKSLKDPVSYFLGDNFNAFIPPDHDSEYYGFPPSKNYVFLQPPQFECSSEGFAPLFSFAQGGLAEAWTGGAYPLNSLEIEDFPFTYNELFDGYREVANRIGINGARDDLEKFFPFHEEIMEPLKLDKHSSILLEKYRFKKRFLNEKLNFYMGRSRVATLSHKKGQREACNARGRCLWGCPGDGLYTPSITLKELKTYSNFKYIDNQYVSHFIYNSHGKINRIITESVKDNRTYDFKLDKLVLAAGTLSSSRIFIESIYRQTNRIIKLKGLMDNRQILLPFINLRMIGTPPEIDSYQYHQIAIGLKSEKPKEYIHGQVTTLKSALIHPIIKSIPFDLKTSVYLFKNLHSALGLVNLNFHDTRRKCNNLTIEIDGDNLKSRLKIKYVPPPDENTNIKKTIKKVRKAFLKIGCIIPPQMGHIRPMGASVHYSGTIPMSDVKEEFTTDRNCQSHDFSNLFIVDGTTLPFLPAKNLTLTLMANAVRVAENAF